MGRRIGTFLVAASAAALIWATAGCGGGSASLTKAEFIKQADAICRQTDKEIHTAVGRVQKEQEAAGGSSAQVQKELVRVGLQLIQEEAEHIQALGSPKGDESTIAAIIREIEEGVIATEKDPIHNHFTKVEAAAAKYGFKDCSEPL